MFVILSLAILFSLNFVTVNACNGYEVQGLSIEVCDNTNDMVGLEGFTATINDKCEVVPSGCIEIKKQMNSGNVSYLVEKKAKIGMPIKFTGKKDLCTLLEKSKDTPEVDLVFKMLQLEQHCPLKAAKICGSDKHVSLAKFKDQMKMLEGNFEGTVRANTDTGNFCIHLTASLVKKESGGLGGYMG